jgi:hypothetical protein
MYIFCQTVTGLRNPSSLEKRASGEEGVGVRRGGGVKVKRLVGSVDKLAVPENLSAKIFVKGVEQALPVTKTLVFPPFLAKLGQAGHEPVMVVVAGGSGVFNGV